MPQSHTWYLTNTLVEFVEHTKKAEKPFYFVCRLAAANGPDSHFSTLKQKSVGKIAGKNLEKVSRNLLTNGFVYGIV